MNLSDSKGKSVRYATVCEKVIIRTRAGITATMKANMKSYLL